METHKINVYSMCIRCGINVRRDYRCNILQYYISIPSSVLFVIGVYICSELAPVLEGSGSAADTHGKVRASTAFLSYLLHVSIVGFFLLFAKNGFVVGYVR